MEELIRDVSRILEQSESGKEVWSGRMPNEVEKQKYMDKISDHFEELYESCRIVRLSTVCHM